MYRLVNGGGRGGETSWHCVCVTEESVPEFVSIEIRDGGDEKDGG